MKNRLPTYPGRVELTDIETGYKKKYDMVMADEPQEEGDPPIKENLLKDEIAALYKDLPENPVPNDVFALLSKSILYVDSGGLVLPSGDSVSGIKTAYGAFNRNFSGSTVTIPVPFAPSFCIASLKCEYSGQLYYIVILAMKGNPYEVAFVSRSYNGVTTEMFCDMYTASLGDSSVTLTQVSQMSNSAFPGTAHYWIVG